MKKTMRVMLAAGASMLVGCATTDSEPSDADESGAAASATKRTSFTTPRGTTGTFTFGPGQGAERDVILTLKRAGKKSSRLRCSLKGDDRVADFDADCELIGPQGPMPQIAAGDGCHMEILTDNDNSILRASCKASAFVDNYEKPKVPTSLQMDFMDLVQDASGWQEEKDNGLKRGAEIARGPITIAGTPETDPGAFVKMLRDVAKQAITKDFKALKCRVEHMALNFYFGSGMAGMASELHVLPEGTHDDGGPCFLSYYITWTGANGQTPDAATLLRRVELGWYKTFPNR